MLDRARGRRAPVVLLAGLGSTAHHFDDFAQGLTARHRVVAVTRRGHRGSSALAIYAVPKSAADLMQRGSSDRLAFPELVARATDDPALRERVEKLYLLTRERVSKHEKWFEAFAERGRVAELSGTHDLIASNPREVLALIDTFVKSLPGAR